MRSIVEGPLIITWCIVLVTLYTLDICNAQSCASTNNRPGRCSALSSCAALLEQMNNGAALYMYSGSFSTVLGGASICGFDGSQFLVCCPIGSASQQYYQPVPPMPTANTYTVPPLSALAFQFGSLNSLNAPIVTGAPQPTWSPWVTAPQLPYTQPASNTPVIFQPTPINVPPATYAPVPQVPTTRNTVPNVNTPPASTGGAGSCGRIPGTINRVVGGNEAKRGSYPWIVALAYNEAGGIQYLCAGSLISAKYLVTSAHCINSQLAYVRLGAHNLADGNEAGAVNVQVKRSLVHENFDIRSVTNDIALIELATPAPQTQTIGLICLPESANFLSQDFVGMNPFIAGWGATKYQGATSARLRDVQVPIVTRQTCETSYKSVFNYVQFNDRIICAGNSNVDACQGDSGGPLMLPQLDGSSNYRFYLLGIVSYGYECARPGFPGVYTRVASFVPWIRQNMI